MSSFRDRERFVMNNNRGRYPPGVGRTGRGAAPNPDYQQSYRQQQPQDQHYVQRGYQQNPQQMQLQQQQQQQQQWSRRPQLPGNASNANDVQKTSQPEASSDPK